MYIERTGYAKYDGMKTAEVLLPEQVAFERVDIIHSEAEWLANKDKYGSGLLTCRFDAPRGTVRPEVNFGGDPEDVLTCFRQAKAISKLAALLAIQTRRAAIPRYKNDGGFNVAFTVGSNIIVELVGKGFDGHELTRGTAVQESIIVPWGKARVNSLQWKATFPDSHKVVSAEQYLRQRYERIKMLCDECKYAKLEVESAIPNEFLPLMPSDLVHQLQHLVILPLMARKAVLYSMGLIHFSVQGNFADGIPQVWEIFCP